MTQYGMIRRYFIACLFIIALVLTGCANDREKDKDALTSGDDTAGWHVDIGSVADSTATEQPTCGTVTDVSAIDDVTKNPEFQNHYEGETINHKKPHCGAALEDHFVDNEILIVVYPEYNSKNYVPDDFSEIDCIDVTALCRMSSSDNSGSVFMLTIAGHSKQNVLDAIMKLEGRCDIYMAEPHFLDMSVFDPPSVDKKPHCDATLDDNFHDNEVLIVIYPEYNGKHYEPGDFSEIECIDIRVLWEMDITDDSGSILMLTIAGHSKQNVLDAIKKLEERDDIYIAEPNYIFKIDDPE